jgi:hypothetical protein
VINATGRKRISNQEMINVNMEHLFVWGHEKTNLRLLNHSPSVVEPFPSEPSGVSMGDSAHSSSSVGVDEGVVEGVGVYVGVSST